MPPVDHAWDCSASSGTIEVRSIFCSKLIQITHVQDRPGHDRRYAIDARKIDARKIERELGWRPAGTFATGIRKTVQRYLQNAEWGRQVQSDAYRDWVQFQYGGAQK